MVTVRLSASPSNARLFLDDLELPSNPFQGDFPRDDGLHRLEVKAPGHADFKKGLQFDRDVSVDVGLQRALVMKPVVDGAKRTVTPRPVAGSNPPTEDEYFKPRTGKKAPKRQLDNDIEFQ